MQQLTLDTFFKPLADSAASAKFSLEEDCPRQPIQIRFGILGSRRDLEENDIEDILNLIIEDFPSDILTLNVCSEGNSSIFAETWATKKKIPVVIHEADWRRDGKKAQIFRDNRIIRDSTHFLIFGGPRSDRPLKTGQQLAKKGKTVYYMPYGTMDIQEFEVPIPSVISK